MLRSLVKTMTDSLFIRLALVMILAAVTLNVVTYRLFVRFLDDRETSFTRNLAQYAHYLTSELGTPPSPAKADELGRRLNMRVTVDGPGGFRTDGDFERFPDEHLRPRFIAKDVEAASLHGYHRIRMHSDQGTITFDIHPTDAERAALRRYGLLYLALTCLILLAVYGVLRLLLRPVRWLTETAAAVRDGDTARRAPEKRGGDLRELSRIFNEMLARLEGLMQSQKRLLLAVSHELRTPLTRLKLRAEMLGDHPAVPAMREDMCEMEAMISSLLESTRLRHDAQALRRECVALERLLADVAGDVSGRPPGVVLELPETGVTGMFDPARLVVLVRNLVDNALKYSGENASPVRVRLSEGGGCAVIAVIDQGPGIPPDALPHLFEPFYRVDASRTRETGGFGLGLSLCQAITQAHGGTIAVESEPGRGTTVTVRLPTLMD